MKLHLRIISHATIITPAADAVPRSLAVVVLVQLPGVSVAYNVSPDVEYTYNKIVEHTSYNIYYCTSDYIYYVWTCEYHCHVEQILFVLFVYTFGQNGHALDYMNHHNVDSSNQN